MIRSLVLLFCAHILYAAGHGHGHAHEPPHFKYSEAANLGLKPTFVPPKQKLRTESAEQLWLETGGAVLLISLAPFVLLCLLPDLNKHQRLLKILLAFAAGGLLGDAFLHLIPHAVDQGHSEASSAPHGHDHRRHLIVGLSILSGIFMFLCIEKMIRLIQHGGGSQGHGHSHESAPPANNNNNNNVEGNKGKKGKNKQQNNAAEGQKVAKKKAAKEFRVSGYLNLAADFTHNFTDGLAIGASFLMSRQLGLVTTMTVLLHELPHEIGDYAILIQSGCSARKAMFLQLTTALGAAAGAALSLLFAGLGPQSMPLLSKLPPLADDMITSCILPFTAGGFIYIAMTSVLPDLLSAGSAESQPRSGFLMRMVQNIAELSALVFGVGMMAILGAME